MRWTVAVGISEGRGGGFGVSFRRFPAECGLVFDAERRGRVAGGLGEVGGGILEDFGGVSGFGLLCEEEAEVRCFWVDFRGGNGSLSLARDPLECLLSSGINLGLFSSPFSLKRTLISLPFSL